MSKPPAGIVPVNAREIAAQIYVSLIGKCIEVSGQKAKMNAAPDELARLSFELAAAFQRVQDDTDGTSAPKNTGFTPDAADFAKWTK